MNQVFQRFVEGIVRETDSNQEEREDLYEELLSHLECSFIDYQKQGFSEEEALRTAMTNFGEEREIGKQLQQAMYPYRREMMLALSVGSLLFAYGVYVCQLFVMGDAHIPWLIVAVLISTALLVLTVRPVSSLNRRLWMNSLLLIHIMIFFYGLLLATDVYPARFHRLDDHCRSDSIACYHSCIPDDNLRLFFRSPTVGERCKTTSLYQYYNGNRDRTRYIVFPMGDSYICSRIIASVIHTVHSNCRLDSLVCKPNAVTLETTEKVGIYNRYHSNSDNHLGHRILAVGNVGGVA